MDVDILIVGAGLFGLTVARELAESGRKVHILEKRDHLGGNCASSEDERTNIEYHLHGTHIFHTDNKQVWDYVNRFDHFIPIQHRVDALVDGQYYPLPFGLATFEKFFKRKFTEQSLKDFLSSITIQTGESTIEEVALSHVGKEFYETFIKGYTEKQWDRPCSKLPSEILKRIPIHYDYNRDYFRRSCFQALPENGFQYFLKSLSNHPNITLTLSTDFLQCKEQYQANQIIYTGAIDAYFDYCFGELEWRRVRFEKQYGEYPTPHQTSVVNFPTHEVTKTRTHIPRFLYLNRNYQTQTELCLHEYSEEYRREDKQDPSYPIRTEKNLEILKKYQKKAKSLPHIHFAGRLAQYIYIDMDQTIASALSLANRIKKAS